MTADRVHGIRASIPAAAAALLAVLALPGCVRRVEPGLPGRPAAESRPVVKIAPAEPPRTNDELSSRGLSGPVRTVTARSYRPSLDGSGKLELFLRTVSSFDPGGRLVSEIQYDPEGKELTRYLPVRDRGSRLSGIESRSPSGELESRVAFEYDGSGRRVRELYFTGDGRPAGGYLYEYGPEGRRIRKTMRTEYEDGSVRTARTDYRYDEAGRLLEETFTDDSPGGVLLRIEHAYRDGLRVRSSDFQRGTWLEFLTFYDRDSRGNPVREASYQIPESGYGDSFASATSESGLPKSFLSSVTESEYEYY